VKRREFITLLGGAAATWPLAARAQQTDRMRRIGVLTPFAADDAERHARLTAFAQGLQQLGWTVGQNIRIDYRWGDGKPASMRKLADELASLAPDVILANSSAAVSPLLQATRTMPIVFAAVADPVGAGYVESLARPGGNATGFIALEWSVSGKWLELLKEIAPRVTRAAVLRDSAIAAGPGFFGAIQAPASTLGVELRPVDVRDSGEIERSVAAFAQTPNGGLIVTGSPAATARRDLIVKLAMRHRLPAVYSVRTFVAVGGLTSYGTDFLDQFRRAAGYVDRILKGEKPSDLPVQAPTKFELLQQPANPGHPIFIKEIEPTAGLLGFIYRIWEARGSEDFAPSFALMRAWSADAIFVLDDASFIAARAVMAPAAAGHRLPLICGFREMAEAGCLFSYSVSLKDTWYRSATFVDKNP
jgi:putative ABC transport system substrate-binding protein